MFGLVLSMFCYGLSYCAAAVMKARVGYAALWSSGQSVGGILDGH